MRKSVARGMTALLMVGFFATVGAPATAAVFASGAASDNAVNLLAASITATEATSGEDEYELGMEEIRTQSLFNYANELMQEHRYAEALNYFYDIQKRGDINGPLFLNMGIAATRLDSLGLARMYFIRASEFTETARAARVGLDFVDDELALRGARIPELAWIQMNRMVYFGISYLFIAGIGIFLLNIGVLLFVLYWLKPGLETLKRRGGVVLVSVGLLLVTGSMVMGQYVQRYGQAIQITREAQVHQLPEEDSDIVQTGFEGFEYIVHHRESKPDANWYRVRMSNGTHGWIHGSSIRIY